MTSIILPRRPRGRPSAEAEARYQNQIDAFCALVLEIRSTMDFAVGSRGWCYILERHGLRKGDFDDAERLITACRKSGNLPLDICAEDASRESIGLERIDSNDIDEEVESWIDYLRDHAQENYTPISFWDDLDTYVEVAVEKLDLRSLFEPVCAQFHVPITNFKGWGDLNSRAAIMKFEGISGRIDQGAGILFNLKPNGDYLTVRANPLENNLVLWKFEKGKRSSVMWIRNTPTATHQWHDLKVRIADTKVEGYLDGKLYLEHVLSEPVSGRIGLWSKADSHMYFDNYTVTPAD